MTNPNTTVLAYMMAIIATMMTRENAKCRVWDNSCSIDFTFNEWVLFATVLVYRDEDGPIYEISSCGIGFTCRDSANLQNRKRIEPTPTLQTAIRKVAVSEFAKREI